MKKFQRFHITVLFLLMSWQLKAQPKATPAQLQKHDLAWLTTSADFDQSGMGKEQIDAELMKMVRNARERNTPNLELDLPINAKMLVYHGYKHPNETGLFAANPISRANNNTPELDTTVHIYQYGDFYISTEADGAVDQANVYYAIRAVNLLRMRYPEAFQTLFSATMQYTTEAPKFQAWVNSNKAFWIAFNENPGYIASNNTIFLGDGYFAAPNNAVGKYRNVALVNIDARNILGDQAGIGSRPVYNKPNPWDNYYCYMKEGLIESLNHEMGHNYIDLAYTYDDRFQKIRSARGRLNFSLAEEAAVLNTSIPYFMESGGFSQHLSDYYYRVTFDPNIATLRAANQLTEYGNVFTDMPVSDQVVKQVFKLPVLTTAQADTSNVLLVILEEHHVQDGFATNPRSQQGAPKIPAFKVASAIFTDGKGAEVKIFKETGSGNYMQIRHPGDLPRVDMRKPAGGVPANQLQPRCPENQQRAQPAAKSFTTRKAYAIKGRYRKADEIVGSAYLVKEVCVSEVEEHARKKVSLAQVLR